MDSFDLAQNRIVILTLAVFEVIHDLVILLLLVIIMERKVIRRNQFFDGIAGSGRRLDAAGKEDLRVGGHFFQGVFDFVDFFYRVFF